MKDNKYMNWYDWNFMPNENITREQFALVMFRMFKNFNKPNISKSSWKEPPTQTTKLKAKMNNKSRKK
jgi:hypothetical protein